jgi:diguanylate cyclase (GGDEF)-like protein
VAGALAETARRGIDLVARLGGEEFAALLPQTALPDAVALAEGMRARVEALAIPHRASLSGPSVTVSLGVAGCIPAQGSSAAELMSAADRALYEAKRSGRNRVASSR